MAQLEGQTPIAIRKCQAPEDEGKQVGQVKGDQQEEQVESYCKNLWPNSEKVPAIESPTSTLDIKPNSKRPCEDQTSTSPKRPRLPSNPVTELLFVEEEREIANSKKLDPIGYWCKNNCWPEEYFEALPGRIENMNPPFAKEKPTASLRRKSSISSTGSKTPTDQESRDGKSAKYRSAAYETLLAIKGSFMDESEFEVTEKSKDFCRMLLNEKQTTPEDTIFQSAWFRKACQKLRGKNESRIVQDISRLIVPSAETLATCGAKNLECLAESVNEQWGSSIAFCGPRPQPDYAVGFSRSAFTEDQLKKFEPFIGHNPDAYSSFFLATFYMYFPFLTCEVKGTSMLDVADRQNAHSMTLAVRGIVELFRLVGREEEIDREILAFSISHDHSTVRIYGHYAVIEGNKTSFYRHLIRMFSFTELDGREKWSAYTFTKNVYEMWAPDQLKRIQSAIDAIPPGVNFDISRSELDEDDGQLSRASFVASAEATPNTSFTQQAHVLKRPRKQE
ncbi:hypothetical protein FQN50_001973 [Emmonsiellopsis sp. PD_5]|nr:hypothetical protein FQN50_001973 [Emmonsiellopsis sp. PD_5]